MEGTTEEYQTNENFQSILSSQTHLAEVLLSSLNEPFKRSLFDSFCLVIPSPPLPVNTYKMKLRLIKTEIQKKAKTDRSISNSLSNTHDKIVSDVKPAEYVFSDNSLIFLL